MILAPPVRHRLKGNTLPPIPVPPQKHPGNVRRIVAVLLPRFSRKLGAMLSAGMSIVAVLRVLENQTRDRRFGRVIQSVRSRIENGSSLAEALSGFPTVFDDLYVNMVQAGEISGQLPETVSRLAGFLERAAHLRRKVQGAMIYPAVVIVLAIAMTAALVAFVVPVFVDFFTGAGARLPAPTQFLVSLSSLLRHYGLLLVGLVAIGAWMLNRWKRTDAGHYWCDRTILTMPLLGDLVCRIAAARFARMLAQMIKSGVPILRALEVSAAATGNRAVELSVKHARGSVEQGETLAVSLRECGSFPVEFVEMLDAGEKTGKIDEMMECIADFYDDEVETTLAGLMSLLEPLLIVVLGIIIGGIVISLFVPIFQMPTVFA